MIKVGVIGLGSMGRNHVRIYSELSGIKLVGIADSNYKLALSLAENYHALPFSNYRELLKQDLDAVSICVPTSLHREVATEAGYAGINMLIEKPIADTIESANEIIKIMEKHNLKLMVGHIERFNPVISTIKKQIVGEEISLIEITRIGPFPPRVKDVGVVVDLATHDIDLLRYLTNSEVKKICSMTSRSIAPHEDAAILLFEMMDGILARLTVDWLTPFKVREINIATREKFIRASLIDQKLTEYSKFKENGSYLVKEVPITFAEPLRLELQAFTNSILQDIQTPTNGIDGLKALEVAMQCLENRK